MSAHALIRSLSSHHVISRHRATNALEFKIADRFDRYVLLDGHQHTGTDQDLPGLSFITEPRRYIRYRSDGGIIEAPFKADGAECCKSMRNSNAKPNLVPELAPLLDQLS